MGMFDGLGDALSGVTSAIGEVVDPVQGLVSGGLSMLGGMNQNSAAAAQAKSANENSMKIMEQTNAFNANEAQKTRDWQGLMRKTQYQEAVNDLQAAGLNPMLAYSQGGAGTPSGATASGVQAQVHQAPVSNALGGAVSAYQQGRMNTADLVLKNEQARSTNAQTEQSRTQSLLNNSLAIKAAEEAKLPAATITNLQESLKVITEQIKATQAQAYASSASAALSKAQAVNEAKNQGKTAYPWYINKLQEYGQEMSNAWDNIRKKK